MKIRIKGNSLRYRLTKTDVNNLANNGYLEECTDFGNQQLVYAIQSSADTQLSAAFINNKITMFIPGSFIDEFNLTDRVGFENNSAALYLLVEKDFTCLDNVAEDQSDNYPNPLAGN